MSIDQDKIAARVAKTNERMEYLNDLAKHGEHDAAHQGQRLALKNSGLTMDGAVGGFTPNESHTYKDEDHTVLAPRNWLEAVVQSDKGKSGPSR